MWSFDNSYAKLPPKFFTKQLPAPVRAPEMVIFNDTLAESLGVPSQLEIFAGNAVPKHAEPIAQAYCGHQFGHLSVLGDGRAVLLGEHITNSGEHFDIQLKGSGRTPYSRGGDGRAALAPMLREYIISEAMHALGIPTTRSLAVVTTGETVMRQEPLQGAVLTRVAASHIRVGTFEFAAHFGSVDDIRALADYTISCHFPGNANAENRYLTLLSEVVKRQASLIAKWQLVGFIHGVMNTDNMAVSGETIDYGPCAFMDTYDLAAVFSSIDTHGRYAYENQPKVAPWNLARFAETLLPLIHSDKQEAVRLAQAEVANFQNLYQDNWLAGMRAKLGLFCEEAEDSVLIRDLLQLMQQSKADYTNTFRALTLGKQATEPMFSEPAFYDWHERWQTRLRRQPQTHSEVEKLMKKHNPAIIPRNHRVEEALAAAENGDLNMTHKLLAVLSNPYEYSAEQEEYTATPSGEFSCYKTFCGT